MFSVYWGSTNYRVLNGKRGQTAQAPRHLTSARVGRQEKQATWVPVQSPCGAAGQRKLHGIPRNRRVGQQDSASYMEFPAIAV